MGEQATLEFNLTFFFSPNFSPFSHQKQEQFKKTRKKEKNIFLPGNEVRSTGKFDHRFTGQNLQHIAKPKTLVPASLLLVRLKMCHILLCIVCVPSSCLYLLAKLNYYLFTAIYFGEKTFLRKKFNKLFNSFCIKRIMF